MTGITSPKPLNIVAVSGGLNTPSKTESLVQAILDELSEAIDVKVHFIKLSEIGPLLGGAFYRNQLPQRVQDDLAAVEAADALIVGTPVYRASFTGLFKHFFDFVEQTALVDVPVLLAASVVVIAMPWYSNINFVHCLVSSKHKLYRLVFMQQIVTLLLNIQ